MKRIYYDFHLHSCLSPCGDNDMTPANIAGMAFVGGLDAIALTDHNTMGNVAALKKAAAPYGITVLCGMELTTKEEVHVVCLFAKEKEAMSFDSLVKSKLFRLKNNPAVFGEQRLMDEADGILGEEEYLLINATDLSFEEAIDTVTAMGGVAFPAHVDKSTNSLLSNLGFVPPDSRFTAAEWNDPKKREELSAAHPYFQGCRFLCNSDAHFLADMHEKEFFITPQDPSPEGIIAFLRGEEVTPK